MSWGCDSILHPEVLEAVPRNSLLLNADVDIDYITDFIGTKIIPIHSNRPRGCQLREVLLH